MSLLTFKDLPDTTTPLNADNLNGNFNYINDRTMNNKFTTTGATIGKFLTSSGSETANLGYNYTDYIEAEQNTQYLINANGVDLGNSPSICFYNSNKMFISGVSYQNSYSKIIQTPANTKYVRLSYATALSTSFSFMMINEKETYSTDETVIGTFLGKPLYRKVIVYHPNSTIGGANTVTNISIPHDISNFGRIVRVNMVDEIGFSFPTAASSSGTTVTTLSTITKVDSSGINFRIINDTWGVRNFYIILEYTKTTD